MSRTSASTLGGPNFGQLLVKLKPRAQRKLLVNDVDTRQAIR